MPKEVISADVNPFHLKDPLVITVSGLPRDDSFSPSPHNREHLLALSTASAFSTLSLGICKWNITPVNAQGGRQPAT